MLAQQCRCPWTVEHETLLVENIIILLEKHIIVGGLKSFIILLKYIYDLIMFTVLFFLRKKILMMKVYSNEKTESQNLQINMRMGQ